MNSVPLQQFTQAHRATWLVFLLNGLMFASWAVQVPAMQTKYQLTPATLSVLLFAIMIGNLAVLPPIGALMRRQGVKVATVYSLLLTALSLAALPFAPSMEVATAILFVYGLGFGGIDYTMNASGTWLGDQLGRPVISGLHASYSIGTLIGAAAGGLLLRADVSLTVHLAAVSAISLCLGAVMLNLLPGRLNTTEETVQGKKRVTPLIALLMLVAFGSSLAEGTVNDWSTVFLKSVSGVSAAQASVGFTAFALTMVAGRLMGDRLTERFGGTAVAIAASLAASTGLLLVSTAQTLGLGAAGFALTGLGLSVLTPLAFTAVWNAGGVAGVGLLVAAVYGGFLAGPPVTGLITHALGLSTAFLLPLGLSILCLVLSVAGVYNTRTPRPSPALTPNAEP